MFKIINCSPNSQQNSEYYLRSLLSVISPKFIVVISVTQSSINKSQLAETHRIVYRVLENNI